MRMNRMKRMMVAAEAARAGAGAKATMTKILKMKKATVLFPIRIMLKLLKKTKRIMRRRIGKMRAKSLLLTKYVKLRL